MRARLRTYGRAAERAAPGRRRGSLRPEAARRPPGQAGARSSSARSRDRGRGAAARRRGRATAATLSDEPPIGSRRTSDRRRIVHVAHRWADAGDETRLARIVGPRDLALRETNEAHHRAAGGGVFLLLGRPCVVVVAAAARSGEQRKPDAAGA